MNAMLLEKVGAPLRMRDIPVPIPQPGQVLLQVCACGVCRTDLHIHDGELKNPKLPLILGHQIVGIVAELGAGVEALQVGQRVGVPWLGSACGVCPDCTVGHENLCDAARFTGYHLDGGFTEYTVANAAYCFPLPPEYTDVEAAPLLCAGLIGYRALRMAGDARHIGLYGFGAAAHILAQVACYQGRTVYAFTRPGDHHGQRFALRLGAAWAGDSDMSPPQRLDAAILFAPVGELVPVALRSVVKRGRVICAGIYMSPIPSFSYDLLWGERAIQSVTNLTREDGLAFFDMARKTPIHVVTERFPLREANTALMALRQGQLQGAAVITPMS